MTPPTNKRLPDFLIVGAQKCGTTTLHDVLKLHPEISMSDLKEVNYFTNESKYIKGLDFYAQYWTPDAATKILGEASPGYMVYPGVAERIRKDLGQIKVIIILRDPVKRAISQYWDNRRKLNENESFEQIFKTYLTVDYSPDSKGYFSRGVYIKYIENYWELFGKNNVHLLTLESFIDDAENVLKELLSFLEISQELLSLDKASNSAMIWDNFLYNFFLNNPKYISFLPKRGKRLLYFGKQKKYAYPQPSPEILSALIEFYHPWNEKLALKTDLNLNKWMSFK